jgi:hypothetical protein
MIFGSWFWNYLRLHFWGLVELGYLLRNLVSDGHRISFTSKLMITSRVQRLPFVV